MGAPNELCSGGAVTFGPFWLFPRERRLEKDGIPIKLGARALDILLVLAERPGNIVGKAELMARVWPGMAVDDSTLRVHMSGLRRALGDGEDGVQYLANVSGRGYAFVADIYVGATGGGQESTASLTGRENRPSPSSMPGSNLPQALTAFIGRSEELSSLQRLMQSNRMVTLTGIGGIGKTRLAIELGRQLLPNLPGGVWLVDLAPLTNPALVASALGAVIGVTVRDQATALETLAPALAKRPSLVIFDNCEHLVEATAVLAETLLAKAPPLFVLATSRETLRIAPEQVFQVSPLTVPPAGENEIADFGAVALFVARCRAVSYDFQLSDTNVASVSKICRRLEGVPLALEMAAARLPMFGVEGLCTRLDELLDLLKFPQRRRDARHLTLRDTLDWSHGLLDETEAKVFRRLGAFAVSFSLDAMVVVAGANEMDDWETMDVLGQLIEKSLVNVELGEPPRYRLLETLRQFAVEKLEGSGESQRIEEFHANFFAALLERGLSASYSLHQQGSKGRYLLETSNIRKAMDWMLADPSRRNQAIAFAPAAVTILQFSLYQESISYMEQAVDLICDDTAPNAAAWVYYTSAGLLHTADRSLALSRCQRAVELYRRTGERRLADALRLLGRLQAKFGRHEEATGALLEAHALFQRQDRRKDMCDIDTLLGQSARYLGDCVEAKRRYEAVLTYARAVGDHEYERAITGHLAELEFQIGNTDRAIELSLEVVNDLRNASWPEYVNTMRYNVTAYLLAQGRVSEARATATEIFPWLRAAGSFLLRLALMQWGVIAALEQRLTEAALLMGFVDAGFARSGEMMEPTERYTHDQLKLLLQAGLSSAEILARARDAASWTDQEAAAFAQRRLMT